MAKKNILFVDDEQMVLDGLQNLLRKQRRFWEMHFVTSAEDALEALNTEPFDVIVTDMRMPRMDGETLLRKVKTEFPHIARIVLSGHTELNSIMKALPLAHQYLSKPCESEHLVAVVNRTSALMDTLYADEIRRLVGNMDRLPPLPQNYKQLVQALDNPNLTLQEIASFIEKDMAMCAKILQIVNSAFFGVGQTVTSVQRAVSILGLHIIKSLMLSMEIFKEFRSNEMPRAFSLARLQEHALHTAQMASLFFEKKSQKSDDAFVAGMLHDVGMLVLAYELPKDYSEVIHRYLRSNEPLHEIESEVLGVSHTEVGGYLLGLWGLPIAVVEAVAHHHRPGRIEHSEFDVLDAVHLSDGYSLEHYKLFVDRSKEVIHVDRDHFYRMGVLDKLDDWKEKILTEYRSD